MSLHEMDDGMKEEEVEIITADDTLQEFDIGEAPEEEDDDMDGIEDDSEKINLEEGMQEEIKDDAKVVYKKHAGPVYSLSVNPVDPRIILSGGGDDVGVIWNREDGSTLHTLSGHQDSVVAVGFSADGMYAATGGYDGVVKIWETASGKLVQSLEGPSQEVEWINWHKKGNIILAGSGDGTVWMWLATTGECMNVFAGHEDSVTCGSFTGSGKMIITGSADATARLWNPKTGECTHVFRGHDFFQGPVCFITCHPNQPLMICGSQDGSARLVQLQAKRILATLSHDINDSTQGTIGAEVEATENSVECGGFCMSMNWAATGCLGGALKIWDLATYQCRHICKHSAGVIKLMWHPTQPIVYTSTVEGWIYAWDARDGRLIKTFSGHTDMILDMAFVFQQAGIQEPIGLLTASDDETVRLFSLLE